MAFYVPLTSPFNTTLSVMMEHWGSLRIDFSNFKEMAKLFMVLNTKHFEHPDAEVKTLALAHFYSENISIPEEDMEEFQSFCTLYSDLS